eukprot:7331392-Heterocapsa_arctica.AAC.1
MKETLLQTKPETELKKTPGLGGNILETKRRRNEAINLPTSYSLVAGMRNIKEANTRNQISVAKKSWIIMITTEIRKRARKL